MENVQHTEIQVRISTEYVFLILNGYKNVERLIFLDLRHVRTRTRKKYIILVLFCIMSLFQLQYVFALCYITSWISCMRFLRFWGFGKYTAVFHFYMDLFQVETS